MFRGCLTNWVGDSQASATLNQMTMTRLISSSIIGRGELLLFLSLALGTAALAGPPSGHPSAAQAIDMLLPSKPAVKNLTIEGQVVSTIDANEFTYIEVSHSDSVEWIAVPLMSISPGSTVRFEEGIVMTDFFSKLLQRSFPRLRFVGEIVVTNAR